MPDRVLCRAVRSAHHPDPARAHHGRCDRAVPGRRPPNHAVRDAAARYPAAVAAHAVDPRRDVRRAVLRAAAADRRPAARLQLIAVRLPAPPRRFAAAGADADGAAETRPRRAAHRGQLRRRRSPAANPRLPGRPRPCLAADPAGGEAGAGRAPAAEDEASAAANPLRHRRQCLLLKHGCQPLSRRRRPRSPPWCRPAAAQIQARPAQTRKRWTAAGAAADADAGGRRGSLLAALHPVSHCRPTQPRRGHRPPSLRRSPHRRSPHRGPAPGRQGQRYAPPRRARACPRGQAAEPWRILGADAAAGGDADGVAHRLATPRLAARVHPRNPAKWARHPRMRRRADPR